MSGTYETEHEITVSAPAETIFALIADVGAWPRLFPPTVHVEHVERGETEELIRIWATANGEAKTWTSRRVLDRAGRRITFRQERSQPPLAAMGGEWSIEEAPGGTARVVLKHDFRPLDDTPEKVSWITRAVDTNSEKELAALKAAAERQHGQGDLVLHFEDTIRVDGDAAAVYDFIYRGDLWPDRLPHVARVVLGEETPGVQTLEMDTRAADGSVHTTESVRVCLPPGTIVYKQLRTPALMTVHTGRWTIRPEGAGAAVTSAHTVVIDPEAVPKVLGADATVVQARAFIRGALGRNSVTTMRQAKAFAERADAGGAGAEKTGGERAGAR
ncbi:aromatase/cyclase [Spirillospora sp. NPDC047279]|uniref:aromatase/cyclase n=1 Tax=Spirillospora sp. NPDC047279 TaxID=3155478 RepID=UPI0033D088F8